MQNIWIIPATDGVYISPDWSYSITGNSFFANQITLKFYDDAACSIPSIKQKGAIIVKGRACTNGIFQLLTTNNIDISNLISLNWNGIINQLQVINHDLVNTNYVQIIFDRK
jgi:hypothetical protein